MCGFSYLLTRMDISWASWNSHNTVKKTTFLHKRIVTLLTVPHTLLTEKQAVNESYYREGISSLEWAHTVNSLNFANLLFYEFHK